MNTDVTLSSFKFGNRNNAFPSYGRLSHIRSVSIRTIAKHVKEIKNAIMVSYRKRGYSSSNIYTFNDADKFIIDPNRADLFSSLKKHSSSQTRTKIHPNNTKINIKDKNKRYKMLKKQAHELSVSKSINNKANFHKT